MNENDKKIKDPIEAIVSSQNAIRSDYYVYQYRCTDTKNVIYVGKGCNDRAWDINAHIGHCPEIANYDILVEILTIELTEKEALLCEGSLINSYDNLLNTQGASIKRQSHLYSMDCFMLDMEVYGSLEIRDALHRLRMGLDITRIEFCKRINISSATYSNFMSGRGGMSMKKIIDYLEDVDMELCIRPYTVQCALKKVSRLRASKRNKR